ncbi:MAG: hypothetical protein AAF732_14500 [Pseudomonadota bacterium]
MLRLRFFATICSLALLATGLGWGTAIVASEPASASPFKNLSGSWRGRGRISLSSGRVERISCRAYYNPKSDGRRLGFAIRCAAPSYKIEIRSQLNYRGGRVSGSWVERTFNASGAISGSARTGKLALRVNGTVSGRINISFSGGSQVVAIRTIGTALRSVRIAMSR